MGLYLKNKFICFYDFHISNGFVTTTNAKYEKKKKHTHTHTHIYIYIMIISLITKLVRLVEIEEFNHTN